MNFVTVETWIAPYPPAQIPACGITAPGSSNILTSVIKQNIPQILSDYQLSPQWCLHYFLQSCSPDNVSFAGYIYLLIPSPCRNLTAIFLFSTLYLYFVTHIIWYFISYTVWLPLLYSPTLITFLLISMGNFLVS